jgi:hypothetical protein
MKSSALLIPVTVPTSVKKLLKGDGYLEMRKFILGLTLDTVCMTLELPAHHALHLQEILDSIPPHQSGGASRNGTRSSASSRQWHWPFWGADSSAYSWRLSDIRPTSGFT